MKPCYCSYCSIQTGHNSDGHRVTCHDCAWGVAFGHITTEAAGAVESANSEATLMAGEPLPECAQ